MLNLKLNNERCFPHQKQSSELQIVVSFTHNVMYRVCSTTKSSYNFFSFLKCNNYTYNLLHVMTVSL